MSLDPEVAKHWPTINADLQVMHMYITESIQGIHVYWIILNGCGMWYLRDDRDIGIDLHSFLGNQCIWSFNSSHINSKLSAIIHNLL